MFVKKLVDKATKKSGGSLNGLRAEDINPRLVFHYGIPAGSTSLAYDPIQKILGISTIDGRIKLFGRDNTQALLESNEAVPSKFLEFLDNESILFNVNVLNRIEVWDIRKKQLSYVYDCNTEISSFTIIKQSLFMYLGDGHGNITILNFDRETFHLVQMQYQIPFEASHGYKTECAAHSPVMFILPQPLVENKRVLILFQDGLITLWEIHESISIFTTGGTQAAGNEVRKVTSACWACPSGSKVVVGYNNGDILLWSVPVVSNHKNAFKTEKEELCAAQNIPISKLNLGYKMDKIPLKFLRYISDDGQASRLYVCGMSEDGSLHSFQVIALQENSESRIIKLALSLPKPCKSMTILSSIHGRSNHKQDFLLLLLESGHLYAFDDSQIERYLLHSQQSKSSSLPNPIMAKIPFIDSTVTVAKLFSENSNVSSFTDEDHVSVKNFPSVIPVSVKGKDGNYSFSSRFRGLTKTNNLYITGHSNGSINFWDASYPFFHLLLSVQQQSEEDHSLTGIAVTALYFDVTARVLVSGDQHGMIRIFRFKPEQVSTKQGCSCNISSIKLVKVMGSVASINVNSVTGHLLVGSDEGCITIIDMEGPAVLSQKRFSSELYTGVISLQSVNGCLNGVENILLVALKDSSVLALDGGSENLLSTGVVRSKKPTKALYMDVLDGQSVLSIGLDSSRVNSPKDYGKQWLVLLCSEKAVRLYSFMYLIQGIKKVQNKKKLHGTCSWASTFSNPTLDTGLILLFTNGKIEIRSLPELSLLKEIRLSGFSFPSSSSKLSSELSCCISSEGEIIVVNGNQEIFLISTLSRREIYRQLDLIGQVCKDSDSTEEGITSALAVHKEKKKGFFNVVMNDIKGSKTKQSQGAAIGDSVVSFHELAIKFSTSNFPLDDRHRDGMDTGDNVDLDIDDIDLEDANDKPKAVNISKLNKQMLTGKLQAIKGKLKAGKLKIGSTLVKDESKEEKNTGGVDEIKKKYGYPLAGDSYIAKLSQSKLNENLKKMEDVSTKATELQGTAQSFSATAKELLQSLEHQKRSS